MFTPDFTTVLSHYGIKGRVKRLDVGPLLMNAEFEPEAGTKLKSITSVLPDIARELGVASLRAEAMAESRNIRFEFPHSRPETVDFKTVLSSEEFKAAKGDLPINLGVDTAGHPLFADLAKMPHLLVAGTTGSGKSVGLNTFILSLIARKQPKELKFVLIDPKRIEFSAYNNQKYMLYPVVTDTADAVAALENLVGEMERRYRLFEETLSKNITSYNEREEDKLPFIVCVIDEFADLIAADKKVAPLVQRLAQKARAAGIHLIMATQRPSVDVVTGVLKANFPTRLSYKVASSADSRTILDETGAEMLLGRGDALFLASDGSLKRLHGAYASEAEIEEMLKPYHGKVAPMAIKKEVNPAEKQEIKPNCVFEFWCSLKSGERKTILAWILSMIKMVVKSLISNRRK